MHDILPTLAVTNGCTRIPSASSGRARSVRKCLTFWMLKNYRARSLPVVTSMKSMHVHLALYTELDARRRSGLRRRQVRITRDLQ